MMNSINGMKWERVLLVAFFGNYVINNIVAGIASLVPAAPGGGFLTAQYITYVAISAITIGLMAWWYYCNSSKANMISGAVFGISGFVISVITTLVSGMAGVLAQSGSLSQLMSVLPNFGPFLAHWSTLILLGLWVIPSALVGWYLQMKASKPMAAAPAMPMSQTM
jgi:hypothetical protein